MGNYPMWLAVDDRTYQVVDNAENVNKTSDFKNRKGYVIGPYVWIYFDKKPRKCTNTLCFWYDEDNNKHTYDPGDSAKEKFKVSRAFDISKEAIAINTNPDEILYNEKALYDMNAKAEIFCPEEKATDDFLKKVIKRAIISKKTDSARLKHKMKEKYSLPNLKSALQTETKMSTSYFNVWCELLGIDYLIIAYDNKTDIDTLRVPVVYDSHKDKISGLHVAKVTVVDDDGVEYTVELQGQKKKDNEI